jgi:hypothetical protein
MDTPRLFFNVKTVTSLGKMSSDILAKALMLCKELFVGSTALRQQINETHCTSKKSQM